MKMKQNLVGLVAVAACAFAAGRIDWGWSNTSMAEPLQQAGEFEATPEMEAMVKAASVSTGNTSAATISVRRASMCAPGVKRPLI